MRTSFCGTAVDFQVPDGQQRGAVTVRDTAGGMVRFFVEPGAAFGAEVLDVPRCYEVSLTAAGDSARLSRR